MRYHIDPFSFERNLTILDFRGFYEILEKKVQEENKAIEKATSGNKLTKCLMGMRDILNVMFMKQSH